MVNFTSTTNKPGYLEMLIHGEGTAVSASILITAKYFTEVLPFKDWRMGFINGLNSMNSEDTTQIAQFQNQFDSIVGKYDGVKETITESPEYHNLIKKIRGVGVPRRWDYERFIAENTSNSTRNSTLGYYDSNNVYRHWTQSDYERMAAGNRISVEPGENLGKRFNIEGDHGLSISQTPYDDMKKMFDPDNIRLRTPKGHLQIGHGGNWQNSGGEPHSDITSRVKNSMHGEREHYDNSSNFDEQLAVAFGIIGGSISAILKYIQFSKDPLPWNRRKYLAMAGAFASGAATGTIPYIVILAIKNPLRNFIEEGLAEVFNNCQTLVQDSILDNLADASGDFVLIMSAIAVRSLLQSGFQFSQLGYKVSAENFSRSIVQASLEQGAFFGIDFLLHFIVPDPTIIVLGIRLTYAAIKIFKNSEHQSRLVQHRIDSFHDVAYATIVS